MKTRENARKFFKEKIIKYNEHILMHHRFGHAQLGGVGGPCRRTDSRLNETKRLKLGT